VDLYLFHLINGLAFKWDWLDIFGKFCAKFLGYFLLAFLLIVLIIKFRKYWRMVAEAVVTAIFARLALVEIIRYFFPRTRPFLSGTNVNLVLVDMDHAYHSFPSGHAAFFFALSTIIYFYNKKLGFLFFSVSFLISLARVFVGIHWPFDVLMGAIVGIFSGYLIFFLSSKIIPHKNIFKKN